MLLVLLAIALAAILGAAAVLAAWPALVVGAAVLYCLDRPARRAARSVVAALIALVAIGYALGPLTISPHSSAAVVWFLAPLGVAALLVAACGGPSRIKARHSRAETYRRQLRAGATAQARADRTAAATARRQARRAQLKRRTGLDVDLLAAAAGQHTGRRIRTLGEQITRSLERRRPRPAADGGPPQWLDLDRDVAADLSRRRSEEILHLADALDRTHQDPR